MTRRDFRPNSIGARPHPMIMMFPYRKNKQTITFDACQRRCLRSNFFDVDVSLFERGIKSPSACVVLLPKLPDPFAFDLMTRKQTSVMLDNVDCAIIYDFMSFACELLFLSAYFDGNSRLNIESRLI
jgi:hypothetical protein